MKERVRTTDMAETSLELVEILTVTSEMTNDLLINDMKSEVFTDRPQELRNKPKIQSVTEARRLSWEIRFHFLIK